MRTKDELFRIAQRQVAARRQRAATLAEENRRRAVAAHPEIEAAQAEKTRCGTAIVLRATRGESEARQAAAQADFERAARTLTDTILAAGYQPEDFVPHYACDRCRDTGIAGGHPCTCVAVLTRALRREEINAASPLALCGFETFDVARYPGTMDAELGLIPRAYMNKALAYCRRYAEAFSSESINLLFSGSAGIGKTHMALAIADTVLNTGHDVLYTSAAALAAQLGKEHFDSKTPDTWLEACKEADLLILDDLGTEFINQVTLSVLYELINTRMLCHRPTIYTTNITDQEVFQARYTEKVASRILGNCKMIRFFGVDQRLKKV
ncbi:MAG: ATP-binding protein [Gemmiger sp.]|nr:ATP-binding protein [Gemmiger sp.]